MANWAGCAIRRLEETDSTNKQARLWAREGAPHGAVVTARRQTAGRGRRGRDWDSATDAGLWLSMVLRPAVSSAALGLLPFAAALAAADACLAAAGVSPSIKWPNDLLLSGRKVAGILLEIEGDAAVMGIGINVRHRPEDFPPDLRQNATSLEIITGRRVPMAALENALYLEIERRIDGWDFMAEYTARCVTLGARVLVIEVNGEFTGDAEGLDEGGALLVRDGEGSLRRVLAGDVSVRKG